MADKNRSHGKIDSLPESIKKEVEAQLLNGRTYEEISDYLHNMGIRFTSPVSGATAGAI